MAVEAQIIDTPVLHADVHAELVSALTIRSRRRVSKDCVISLDGRHFEVRQGFLAGRIVVFGGRTGGVTTDTIVSLAPRRPAAARVANVYAADTAGALHGAARLAKPLVYVPNSLGNSVDVIDPHSFKVVRHFTVGAVPQHVTPAWDLKTLYVTDSLNGEILRAKVPFAGKWMFGLQ